MARTPKQDKQEDHKEDEGVILERMNEALKRMMSTPPETHKEMVERRRGQGKTKRKGVHSPR